MGPMDGGRLVNGCHWPWMLGLSVWKGFRIRMMSRPDWLVSLVKSSETCEDVLLVMISSLTVPFTEKKRRKAGRERGAHVVCTLRSHQQTKTEHVMLELMLVRKLALWVSR